MLNARKALDLDSKSVTAHHALAQAQLGLGRFKAAVLSARAGERLLKLKADRTTEFSLLLDQIAAVAALQGDYTAFDGRVLEVCLTGYINAPVHLFGVADSSVCRILSTKPAC